MPSLLPQHPLGVRPSANALLDGASDAVRAGGLGALRALPDALVLEVLACLPGADLFRLSAASRALYAFTAHEDLWRTLTLGGGAAGCPWRFAHSWRATYAAARGSAFHALRAGGAAAHARGLYSDTLHHAFRCSAARIDPRWLAHDNLPREAASALTPQRFQAEYEARNTPVVLRGAAAAGWPGQAQGAWGAEALEAAHGATPFHCAGFSLPLRDYLAYSRSSSEDNPLYLFDKEFVRRAPALGGYTPPPALGGDLFELLGEEGRPDWRWLILGGAKSGSVFHVDPNGTSAWNACLQGRKKWLLFPPDLTPPGVWAAQDGSEVCVPLSVMEWMLQFYGWSAKARDRRAAACRAAASGGGGGAGGGVAGGKRPRVGAPRAGAPAAAAAAAAALQPVYEGVVEAGDVIFVPRGWWHLVLNLDPMNVAVTQNFCSPCNLPHVLRFLRDKPYAVSGVPQHMAASLHGRLVAALQAQRPELLAAAGVEGAGAAGAAGAAASGGSSRPRWGDIVGGGGGGGGSFSLASMFGKREGEGE